MYVLSTVESCLCIRCAGRLSCPVNLHFPLGNYPCIHLSFHLHLHLNLSLIRTDPYWSVSWCSFARVRIVRYIPGCCRGSFTQHRRRKEMLLVTSPSFTGFTLPLLGIKARCIVRSCHVDDSAYLTRFFCGICQSNWHGECFSFLEVAHTLIELVTWGIDEIWERGRTSYDRLEENYMSKLSG